MPPDAERGGLPHPPRHDQHPAKDTDPRSLAMVPEAPATRPGSRDPHVDARVRAAAIKSGERGWYVFPTRPDGKEPRPGTSWPKVATNDPGLIARCRWRPGENYGIAAKPSRLVIIDLDVPKSGYEFPPGWRDVPGINDGADVLAELAIRAGVAEWPHTFTVDTPSGGRHLYYLAPDDRVIGNQSPGPKVDVRGIKGDGGYVLGPGSVLGGRAYEVADDREPEPLPGWIADLLDPPQGDAPRPGPRPWPGDAASPGVRVAGRLEGLMATVANAQPGERNNVLHWAACRAAEMIAAGQLGEDQVSDSLGWAAARAGLDDGEARRTIMSALRQPFGRTA
jgi:hypothetical protein